MSDSDQARMHTGVVRPRGVNMGNRRLIGAEMEGCQVRDRIVGERDMPCSRNVSMAAYGKSMVVSTQSMKINLGY